VNSRCGACHAAFQEGHGHQKVNCLSCHSVHHAFEVKAILVKSTPELCTDCHH
jgi:predicted CXXCH cytochrome family protein